MVFESKATYDHASLNTQLMSGPNKTNSLLEVLLRFRLETTAVSCDLEQTFHSFFVSPRDPDFLRFLWYQDSDLTKPVVSHRKNVQMFGKFSNPAVANFAISCFNFMHEASTGVVDLDV